MKPIFGVFHSRTQHLWETNCIIFYDESIFSHSYIYIKGFDRVKRLSLPRVEKGKLTKIPDFFLVKSQDINSTEKKVYQRGFTYFGKTIRFRSEMQNLEWQIISP